MAEESEDPFNNGPDGQEELVASPLFDIERSLALLLGLHAHSLYQSLPIQPAEADCARWRAASFLRGGLQVGFHVETCLFIFNLKSILMYTKIRPT